MKNILLTLSLLIIWSSAQATEFDGNIPSWKKDKETFKKSEETFKKVFQTLKEKYVDKSVSEDDLYRAATEGMLAALNPGKENWNTLLTPRNAQDMNIDISGQLVGIGTTLDFDEATGNAKVRGVIPHSAAEKAKLEKNDLILSVNGKRYSKLVDMVGDIRGKAGEKVRLKILRGDRILDVAVAREIVKIPFFISAMINPKTGYLSIQSFAKNAGAETKKILESFGKPEKLILDLRGSPGGVFDQAQDVANLFLEKDQVIIKTQGRDGATKEYKAQGNAWSPETKIIVLTDEETASSAEILAVTLKENRKALIIGGTTVGKGTVESLEVLPNDYQMKYSVLRLLSPSGKSYDGKGLTPDFQIALDKNDSFFFPYEFIKDMPKRLEKDAALRFAVDLPLK